MYGLTLREQNLCVACLAFALSQVKDTKILNGLILSFLIILKVKEPVLYLNFIKNEASVDDLMENLRHHDKENLVDNENRYYRLELMLAICENSLCNLDVVKERYQTKIKTETDVKLKDRWEFILRGMNIGTMRLGENNVSLSKILQKIELFYSFF